MEGKPVAFQLVVGNNNTLTFVTTGNYSMTELIPGPHYDCTVDEVDSPEIQPYRLVEFSRVIVTAALGDAVAV